MSILNTRESKGLTPEERQAVIDHLVTQNEEMYNLTKAAEELQELALVLLQRAHKGDKVSDKSITDEIGDVKIRLIILEKKFSKAEVFKRMNKKLTQFKSYIEAGKYKNI